MRIWKTQSKVAACNLQGRTVAVRVWDSFDHTYTYDIVKVAEVSPTGIEFAAFEGGKFTGYDVADITRVF